MERALGSDLGGRLLKWWSSGRKEEVSGLGSAVEPCKKVRSGEVPDVTSPIVKLAWLFSFRSSFLRRGIWAFIVKGYEASVPEVLTVPVAYHAVVLHRSLRGPYDEARVVGRTTAGPPMLVSGRLQSRWVGHIVGPAVRGREDVTVIRSINLHLVHLQPPNPLQELDKREPVDGSAHGGGVDRCRRLSLARQMMKQVTPPPLGGSHKQSEMVSYTFASFS
ncbi:hypothetical protein BHE74_00001221 [Ensete ventricosum]|nr:hypothetical protein BHE74_00001221 [Ensete ventricosum]